MPSYSDERREAVMAKLLPARNLPVRQIAQQEGISEATVYKWRKEGARLEPACAVVGITVRTHQRQTRPTTYHAVAPYRLWSWDCAWLPGPVKGTYYYLVMIIDIFSPKFAGWEVFLGESADNVRSVLERAILAEHIVQQPLVLHADNGSAFKAVTLLEKLRDMNIEPSFSRPRISNDNPYSEALFRTCKYVPFYPVNGIAGLPAARYWMQGCVRWYNHEHGLAPDPDSIRA